MMSRIGNDDGVIASTAKQSRLQTEIASSSRRFWTPRNDNGRKSPRNDNGRKSPRNDNGCQSLRALCPPMLCGGKRSNLLAMTKHGFTLVEIILTVAILSFGLVGILRAYITSLNALDAAQENMESFCLLKNKMGEVELQDKEEKGLREDVSRGRFEGGFDNYQWELDIHALTDVKLNEAAITVYRDGHRGRYSLTTYVDQKK